MAKRLFVEYHSMARKFHDWSQRVRSTGCSRKSAILPTGGPTSGLKQLTNFPVVIRACIIVCITTIALSSNHSVANSNTLPCKYSVRDVAFVNVHGKSWQLDVIKPKDLSSSELSEQNGILTEKLSTSNLGYAWHEPESDRARELRSHATSNHTPQMYLTDQTGRTIPIELSKELGSDFETQIDRVVHSPMREQLLSQLSESLCVFLLIRGPNESENAAARNVLDETVAQVEKQMWMMEKASDNGPTVLEVNVNDPTEDVALRSIGIDTNDKTQLPAVAIMFGQARRLGDIVRGEQIQKKQLVSLASICGSDCECALDRQWLYGDQMVHDWTNQLERQTEDGLDFDPRSAFVMAEVAQILQKNERGGGTGNAHVNLGGGLVIHDLEPENDEVAVINVPDMPTELLPEEIDSPAEPTIEVSLSESPVGIPWFLFAFFAVATIAVVINRMTSQK